MPRAFVAVVPPEEVLDAVAAALGDPDVPGARLMRREQWHLTVQFLGNRADLERVGGALEELAVRPGAVRLGGFGVFPNEQRARVLWLGVAEGAVLCNELAAAVGALLAPRGYPPEDRDFHPHLTLARCKTPADMRPVLAALPPDPVGPEWTLDEVVLFESVTRSTGARYLERGRFPLGA